MNEKKKAEMGRDVDKIVRVVRSCKTKEHFEAAQQMVDLFGKKWMHNVPNESDERLVIYNRFSLFGFNLGRRDALLKDL